MSNKMYGTRNVEAITTEARTALYRLPLAQRCKRIWYPTRYIRFDSVAIEIKNHSEKECAGRITRYKRKKEESQHDFEEMNIPSSVSQRYHRRTE